MSRRKQKCPVCGKPYKILYGKNGHVTLVHPDYKQEDNNVRVQAVTPTLPETPKPEVPESTPTLPVAEVKLEPVKDDTKPKVSFSAGRVFMIIGGLALIGVSIFTGKQWFANYSQSLLGIITALLFGAGGCLIFFASKKKGSNYSRPSLRAGVKKFKGDANSLILYAKLDPVNPGKFLPWKIEFDYLKYPPGLKRKLRNDGKYYSFNICKGTSYSVDKDGNVKGLEDLTLPDTAYCDPRLLKDAVEMRYSREYYTPDPTLFQKIKPVIFVVIVAVGAIILIMVGNPPAA